jgi:hypothetical protein
VLSDFRAFHRLTPVDVLELPAWEFWSLVWRLSAYGGVVANRMAAQAQQQPPASGDQVIDITRETIENDSVLSELIA